MASPTITFREFLVSGVNPSGRRQYKAGDAAVHPSFYLQLGTAANQALDFDTNDITLSGINSATKVVLAHMDSSGDLTTQLFNIKFWLPSVTSFNGTYRFNQLRASGWSQNQIVQNNSAEQTSVTLPTSGNILRQDGSGIITGSGDAEVTEWVYLSVYTGTDVNIGVKGGAGQNTFRYRLTADYY